MNSFLSLMTIFYLQPSSTAMVPHYYFKHWCPEGISERIITAPHHATAASFADHQYDHQNASDISSFVNCSITFVGRGSMMSLFWRHFRVLSPDPACLAAFVAVSASPGEQPLYKSCGTLQELSPVNTVRELYGRSITIRVFANFTPSDRPSNATSNSSLSPEISFLADITSFYPYCDKNAEKFYRCQSSRRCVDLSLRCDGTSWNCVSPLSSADLSDEANCDVPEAKETDLLPLWVTPGILAACAAFCWCFWKPGYLPWRLSRLRNSSCCGCLQSDSYKCCDCCKPKGTCQELSGETGADVSRKTYGGDGTNAWGTTATENGKWISFLDTEGGHLREVC